MNWRHSFHSVITALGLAASALFAANTQAAVRTPYQLDTAFNGSGIRIGLSASEGGMYNTDGFGATRLAFDGDDTITVNKTNAWSVGTVSMIAVQRISKSGTLVEAWKFAIQSFEGAEWRIVAVRDVLVASAQRRLFILVDAKKASSDPNELVRSFLVEYRIGQSGFKVTRVGLGTGDVNSNHVGVRLAQRGDRLLVLQDNRLLPGQDFWFVADSVELHLTAFTIKPSTSTHWSELDPSWGTNGRRSYHHEWLLLGDPGDPPVVMHSRVRASQLEIAPTGYVFIAGDIKEAGADQQLFVLKLEGTNGDPAPNVYWPAPPRAENQGWLTLGGSTMEDEATGLVLRQLQGISYDIFLISNFQRACGKGLIVYALDQNGVPPSPSRTWTHGGGSTAGVAGQDCDSIQANEMTLIHGASSGAGARLAIVGRYIPQGSAPSAAALLTLNPDNLQPSPGEQVQEILTDDEYQGDTSSYSFKAARYHTGQKRLLAVGTYVENYNGRTDDLTLIARMKEAPLFSDGFEGN
ncbi:MAG TPA: hypothetical protein VFN29_11710 [Chiayiivirga sp.]|nr:hypothetical protein [Chiayiivirga sp.]